MNTFSKRSALALCSMAIAFFLMTNASATYAQQECNSLGVPLATSGDISLSDTVQSIRLFRDGRGTTCAFARTPMTSAVSVNADSYTFTNTTGGPICVFVDLDSTGCGANSNIGMAAYLTSYNPASILTNLIGDPGLSTAGNFATSMSFSVPAGATYIIVVHTIANATTCASYTFKRYVTNNCRVAGYDAANDGSADLAVVRTGSDSVSRWYSIPLTGGTAMSRQFGSVGDIPTPGDYDGDEATDLAVFRQGTGFWYTSTNPATNYGAKQWGAPNDFPVQGDYDRDGITDLAVFRPSNSTWYVLFSSNSTSIAYQLGQAGDKPVPADYDGDGKTDFAVFRPSNGLWTTAISSGNYGSLGTQLLFGNSTDTPVPADYDGDGKADIAVFRPTEGWYIFRSSVTTGQTQFVPFGASGDIPQPADYDGDRKADEAVFRPSSGTWYVLKSSTGTTAGAQFGQSGDRPVTAQNLVQ